MDFFLVTGCILSALILLVGHYFPWHKLLARPLGKLQSYSYGSGAVLCGFSFWRYFGRGDMATPAGLVFIYFVAGAVVWGAYWLDGKGHEMTLKNRKAEGRE